MLKPCLKCLGTTSKDGWPGITDDLLQAYQAGEQVGDNLQNNHPESYPPSQKCLGQMLNKKRPCNLETFSDIIRKGWQSFWKEGHIRSKQGLFGNMLTAAESG